MSDHPGVYVIYANTTHLNNRGTAMTDSSYQRYRELKLRRENTLRLFEPLHQNDAPYFRRASGSSYCEHCGLTYREHYDDEENFYFDDSKDKRLCNGDVVHL